MDHDPRPGVDTGVAHSARVWNYLLGGKDNYAADRAAADQFKAVFPQIVGIARADRAFLGRAVRFAVGEAGVRQFLDIGTGLPTMDNTHEVAQRVAPEARIVYVDNDPLVLAHARALLTSAPEGRCSYIEADLRRPADILAGAAKTLDFGEPVAVMLLGILHFVPDVDEAYGIVARLLDAVPSGSFLVATHATMDPSLADETELRANAEAREDWDERAATPLFPRGPEEFGRFFDGLELQEPGLVSMSRWRPEPTVFGEPPKVLGLAGVGRKP
ncbi:SAM-dependent methyltransferase [Streptomyces sp. B8F3]|uniref:SAM-dependent methyltransferase n=1 Tax=unclassified Streptomyces TaxID=2593676 RepID=UPI00325DACBD